MLKAKKSQEKYITHDKANGNFKVRVPGFKQITFKSAEEAISERNRLIEAKNSGRISIDTNITVGDWIELFLQNHCQNCKQSTIEGYQTDLERCCEPLYDIPVKDCKTSDVDDVLLELCRNGTAKSTVTRTRSILHKLFNTLIIKNYLPASLVPGPYFIEVTNNMIIEKEDKIDRQAFPEETLNNLVSAAQTFKPKDKDMCDRYAAAITILINTGMRVSEFLALTKNDIEFNDNNTEATIYIRHSLRPVRKVNSDDNKCWSLGPPKNSNAYRHFAMGSKDVVDSLKYLHSLQHKKVEKDGTTYDFLFASNSGSPVLLSNFSDNFRIIRQQASAYKDVLNRKGTKVIRHYIQIHEIRHSVATILAHITPYDKHVDAADMLGHTVEVFRNIYVHPIEDNKKELAKQLSERLKTGQKSSA